MVSNPFTGGATRTLSRRTFNVTSSLFAKPRTAFMCIIAALFTLHNSKTLPSPTSRASVRYVIEAEVKPPNTNRDKQILLISNGTEDVLAQSSPLQSPSYDGKDLVVTFVDSSYLEPFSIWLNYYKRYDKSNRVLLLVAVSDQAREQILHVLQTNQQNILENLGPVIVATIELPPKHLNAVWTARLELLRRLVTTYTKLNVLFTDVDALWLKDPEPLYRSEQHLQSHVVASRGTFPDECPQAPRTTICFGFVYFRSSENFQTLAGELLKHLGRYEKDDQRTINCVLYNQYNQSAPETLEDGSFRAEYRMHEKFGNNLMLSILPYSQAVRTCKNKASVLNATVAHCLTNNKVAGSKISMFKKFGLVPSNATMWDWT